MKMTAQKAYKYRIYPTKSQRTRLENQFSMCKYLYNWNLQQRMASYQKDEKTINYYDQAKELPRLKKERPWFKSVYSQVLQDVLKRLDRAYQGFFRRVKSGDKPGFPKFKKKGQWNSITYPQYHNAPQDTIKVPKIGDIRCVCHRAIPEGSKIKTLTISKEGHRWFACFSLEYEVSMPEPKQAPQVVGIDVGLIDFYYDSEGHHVPVPRFLRRSLVKLKKLQRRLSKAKKRSGRWYRCLRALQRIYYKVKCQRLDWLHKVANALLSNHDIICIEDLKIRNMVRRPRPKQDKDGSFVPNGAVAKAGLNKSITDASWGTFFGILFYKARELGKQLVRVDPRYTSQVCHKCGVVEKKSLGERDHVCSCGFETNRDHNASLNILTLGLESLGLLDPGCPAL